MNELPIFSGAETVIRDELIPAIDPSNETPSSTAETLLTAAALTLCLVVSSVSPASVPQQSHSAATVPQPLHSPAYAATETQEASQDAGLVAVEVALAGFQSFIEELASGAPAFAEPASKIMEASPCASREDAEAWAEGVLGTSSLA